MEVKNFRYVSKCCATCRFQACDCCVKNEPFKLEFPNKTICDDFEFDDIGN